MYTTDFKSLGIAPKQVITSADGAFASQTLEGLILLILADVTCTAFKLTYDPTGVDYGAVVLKAGNVIMGVKTITIASGSAIAYGPKLAAGASPV